MNAARRYIIIIIFISISIFIFSGTGYSEGERDGLISPIVPFMTVPAGERFELQFIIMAGHTAIFYFPGILRRGSGAVVF